MKKLSILMVSISLALISCGKKKEGGGEAAGGGGGGAKVVASCDQRNMPGVPVKNCLEYTGKNWTKKEIQARCGGEGQAFIDGPCPTEGVVLSCLQEGGKPMEAMIRNYENPEKAKQLCETIGVVK
ncbi:MAG: hypothetical protein SFX73_28140 [Kofleriaceae bacterium]|nr:hypothetical protein [Kofleriaceae bacterium]